MRYFFSIVCLQSPIKKELTYNRTSLWTELSIRKLRDPDYQYTPSTNVPGTDVSPADVRQELAQKCQVLGVYWVTHACQIPNWIKEH